jgi:hypothetical protein
MEDEGAGRRACRVRLPDAPASAAARLGRQARQREAGYARDSMIPGASHHPAYCAIYGAGGGQFHDFWRDEAEVSRWRTSVHTRALPPSNAPHAWACNDGICAAQCVHVGLSDCAPCPLWRLVVSPLLPDQTIPRGNG